MSSGLDHVTSLFNCFRLHSSYTRSVRSLGHWYIWPDDPYSKMTDTHLKQWNRRVMRSKPEGRNTNMNNSCWSLCEKLYIYFRMPPKIMQSHMCTSDILLKFPDITVIVLKSYCVDLLHSVHTLKIISEFTSRNWENFMASYNIIC